MPMNTSDSGSGLCSTISWAIRVSARSNAAPSMSIAVLMTQKKPSASVGQPASLMHLCFSSSLLAGLSGQLKGAFYDFAKLRARVFPRPAPVGPVFHDPVQQGALKTDVMPRFLALDPLVPQNLFALGQKLPVQRRVHHHIFRLAAHFAPVTHGKTLWPHDHREAYLIITDLVPSYSIRPCEMQRFSYVRGDQPGCLPHAEIRLFVAGFRRATSLAASPSTGKSCRCSARAAACPQNPWHMPDHKGLSASPTAFLSVA